MDGQETRYLIDTVQPYAQVLEEYTPGGAVLVSYVYGNDLISQTRYSSSQPQTGTTTYYHVDGLGSTTELTDSQGAIVSTSRYDAFGKTIAGTGTVDNKYLFAGEQYDLNLGDYYLRARYYDSDTGRFTRRDDYEGILSNPLSLHRYNYVNGNPVNYGDPSGYVNLTQVLTTIVVANILWEVVNPFNFGGFDPFSDSLFPKIDPTGGIGGKINFDPIYDFVQESILYRSMNQISRNRNVAVVQYRDASGKLKLRAAENVTEAEAGLTIHAEQMITQEILQMGIRPKDVVRIYSEYQPCNYGLNNCASFLSQNFPSAKIYWSFDYNVSKSLKEEVLQRRRMEFEKYDLYKK